MENQVSQNKPLLCDVSDAVEVLRQCDNIYVAYEAFSKCIQAYMLHNCTTLMKLVPFLNHSRLKINLG